MNTRSGREYIKIRTYRGYGRPRHQRHNKMAALSRVSHSSFTVDLASVNYTGIDLFLIPFLYRLFFFGCVLNDTCFRYFRSTIMNITCIRF